MSLGVKSTKGFGRVITATWVVVCLASGCSTAPDDGTLAAFLKDFAREVLAAWLL